MKTTILGGLIFLAPVVIVAILLGKAYQISLTIVRAIDHIIPIDRIAGVAALDIAAICLIVLICYLAGLLAKSAFVSSKMEKIDGLLMDVLPFYSIFKTMVSSVARAEELEPLMKPVVARFDDYEQIAFEIERNDERAVLYLPGSPSAWSGTTIIVDIARVAPLEMPTHQAVKLMRVMGRGSLETQTNYAR